MKKIIAILLAMMLVLTAVGCAAAPAEESTAPAEKSEGVMTHDEFDAAAIDDEVVVETCVQATQGWWFDDEAGHGKITVYAQDADGAYFIYELKCDEADAEKFVPGAKIRVTGYKAEWSGEIEIVDATFEFIDGDKFIAEPVDYTDLLGKDELIEHQNEYVAFKGLTVKSIAYKNEEVGNDIYVTVSKDGADYDFCVESYLTDAETEVYKAVGELKEGDVIDVEGFLYWYEGVNTHLTAVTAAE